MSNRDHRDIIQVQKKERNYPSGQRLYQVGDIWVDLEKWARHQGIPERGKSHRRERDGDVKGVFMVQGHPPTSRSGKLLRWHWVTGLQELGKYWLIKMLKIESKRPYGLRRSSKYLQPTWHFLAKLRMRRKKGDAQVARWAKQPLLSTRPKAKAADPPHMLPSRGVGRWGAGVGGAPKPQWACNTHPLGDLCHEQRQPGPNKNPSVAAIHTHSTVFAIWLITPRTKRMVTLASYRLVL